MILIQQPINQDSKGSKKQSAAQEHLNQFFKKRQHTQFSNYECHEKNVGKAPGYCAEDTNDHSKSMLKAYKKNNQLVDDQNRRDWIQEYLTASSYKRFLPTLSPDIALVTTPDNQNVFFRSEYLENFETIENSQNDENRGYKNSEIHSFEKVFAVMLYEGEVDNHSNNLGAKKIDNQYHLAKIDHGRSAFYFYSTESELREKLKIGHYQWYAKRGFYLNVHKLRHAVHEVNKIKAEEIETLIKARFYHLRQVAVDISNPLRNLLYKDSPPYYPKPEAIYFTGESANSAELTWYRLTHTPLLRILEKINESSNPSQQLLDEILNLEKSLADKQNQRQQTQQSDQSTPELQNLDISNTAINICKNNIGILNCIKDEVKENITLLPNMLSKHISKIHHTEKQIAQYSEAEAWYVQKYLQQLEVMKSFEKTLDIICRMDDIPEAFVNGGWLEEIGGDDPIQWLELKKKTLDNTSNKISTVADFISVADINKETLKELTLNDLGTIDCEQTWKDLAWGFRQCYSLKKLYLSRSVLNEILPEYVRKLKHTLPNGVEIYLALDDITKMTEEQLNSWVETSANSTICRFLAKDIMRIKPEFKKLFFSIASPTTNANFTNTYSAEEFRVCNIYLQEQLEQEKHTVNFLHIACQYGSEGVILAILRKLKKEEIMPLLSAVNENGNTPLHLYFSRTSVDKSVLTTINEKLGDSIHDLLLLKNTNGTSLLQLAILHTDITPEEVGYFIALLGNQYKEAVNITEISEISKNKLKKSRLQAVQILLKKMSNNQELTPAQQTFCADTPVALICYFLQQNAINRNMLQNALNENHSLYKLFCETSRRAIIQQRLNILDGLEHNSEQEVLNALEKLESLFSENITNFHTPMHYISLLIKISIESHHSAVNIKIISMLAKWALINKTLQNKILKDGLPYLINLLKNKNVTVKIAALNTINNSIVCNKDNQNKIRKLKGLLPVIHLLNDTNVDVKITALKIINKLVEGNKSSQALLKQKGSHLLFALLTDDNDGNNGNKNIIEATLKAILLLNISESIAQAKIENRLIELLSDDRMTIRNQAIQLLILQHGNVMKDKSNVAILFYYVTNINIDVSLRQTALLSLQTWINSGEVERKNLGEGHIYSLLNILHNQNKWNSLILKTLLVLIKPSPGLENSSIYQENQQYLKLYGQKPLTHLRENTTDSNIKKNIDDVLLYMNKDNKRKANSLPFFSDSSKKQKNSAASDESPSLKSISCGST